jgi:ankyrin repeat protein
MWCTGCDPLTSTGDEEFPGLSALHCAALCGGRFAVPILRLLLASDHTGQLHKTLSAVAVHSPLSVSAEHSLLHFACLARNFSAIRYLVLECGSDPSALNAAHQNALHLAMLNLLMIEGPRYYWENRYEPLLPVKSSAQPAQATAASQAQTPRSVTPTPAMLAARESAYSQSQGLIEILDFLALAIPSSKMPSQTDAKAPASTCAPASCGASAASAASAASSASSASSASAASTAPATAPALSAPDSKGSDSASSVEAPKPDFSSATARGRLHATDNNGFTLLHYLARVQRPNIDLYHALLNRYGLPLEGRDARGYTPLYRACLAFNAIFVPQLLMSGAKLRVRDGRALASAAPMAPDQSGSAASASVSALTAAAPAVTSPPSNRSDPSGSQPDSIRCDPNSDPSKLVNQIVVREPFTAAERADIEVYAQYFARFNEDHQNMLDLFLAAGFSVLFVYTDNRPFFNHLISYWPHPDLIAAVLEKAGSHAERLLMQLDAEEKRLLHRLLFSEDERDSKVFLVLGRILKLLPPVDADAAMELRRSVMQWLNPE